jgi:sortase A
MTRMPRRIPLLAAVVLLAACSEQVTTAGTIEPPSTTPAPTSTSTSTTSTTSTTVLPSTTTSPTTTTTEPLGVPVDPPPPRANEPYLELGYIAIPRLNLLAPLLEGITLTTLDRGPGHWPGTAMPGHRGNMVVAGHRTSHSRPFRYLDQLVPGDEMIVGAKDGTYTYRVVATEIVYPDAMHIVDQRDGYTATLFACHPVGSTRQRIVVHLELSGPPFGAA